MKITDSRTVSVELDNALTGVELIARESLRAGAMLPGEARALLIELERLRAMERRAIAIRDRPMPPPHLSGARTAIRSGAAEEILGGKS